MHDLFCAVKTQATKLLSTEISFFFFALFRPPVFPSTLNLLLHVNLYEDCRKNIHHRGCMMPFGWYSRNARLSAYPYILYYCRENTFLLSTTSQVSFCLWITDSPLYARSQLGQHCTWTSFRGWWTSGRLYRLVKSHISFAFVTSKRLEGPWKN